MKQFWVLTMFAAAVASVASADEPATVPKLVGERVRIAEQLARLSDVRHRGGVYYVAPQNWRDDVKPQVIYLQTPQPGTVVPRGTLVATWTLVRAADDAATIEVPDLRGLSFEQAAESARAQGIRLLDSVEEGDVAGRVVADQYPRPGTRIYAGTSLLLTTQRLESPPPDAPPGSSEPGSTPPGTAPPGDAPAALPS